MNYEQTKKYILEKLELGERVNEHTMMQQLEISNLGMYIRALRADGYKIKSKPFQRDNAWLHNYFLLPVKQEGIFA